MAIPASCTSNCPNTSQPSDSNTSKGNDNGDRNGPPSLPVILGVLGGMSLIALVVFVIVPLVRRRKARKGYFPGDVESNHSVWSSIRFKRDSHVPFPGLSKHKPPVRHQYKTPGPDALLPLTLPTVSTFTWSDMRSHHNGHNTDEEDGTDRFDVDSFPTDNATVSHRSKHDHSQANSVRSGASNSHQDAHRGRASAASHLLSPQSSPPPPGLPSKATFPEELKETGQATPILSFPFPPASPSYDTTLLHWSMSSSHNRPVSSQVGYLPRSANGMVSGKDPEPDSRPGSIQLPSPPDSPPFPAQPEPQPGSLMRSRSTRSHSQTSQQGPPDYRFNPSRLRPTLTNSQSAPSTALPFRPAGSSSALPTSSGHHASSSVSGLASPPLTSAFRSGLTSASRSSSSNAPSSYHGASSPPPISGALSPQSRSRSGSISSVASERPARTHMESRLRPNDMLRRASISTNTVSPVGLQSTTIAEASHSGVADSPSSSRAYLRMSESHHTTPRYEAAPAAQEHSITPSYFDVDPRGRSRAAMASSTSLAVHPSTLQSHTPDYPSFSSTLHPRSASRQSSRDHSSSHVVGAYVRKKDSPALRPLPASPFMHSPPQSPPSRSRSGTVTSGMTTPQVPASRSRAGSIRTLPEPPREEREGSIRERDREWEVQPPRAMERRRSSRATLPPLPSLQPMDFGPYSYGHDRSPDQKKK
ncbi:hypothetical protein BXZ70DRAFT_910152 [Cristinia sonorae]|uniref:Uncharacterized protein n=1 Tax=Cristinia sonorae TaxID=1940300 RepID=A0A8K0XLF9_9AGAR|nr:hypothetical protein BXZ70DRAFT_910152 [Cristinia sonorae]